MAIICVIMAVMEKIVCTPRPLDGCIGIYWNRSDSLVLSYDLESKPARDEQRGQDGAEHVRDAHAGPRPGLGLDERIGRAARQGPVTHVRRVTVWSLTQGTGARKVADK